MNLPLIAGQVIVAGQAEGEILFSDVPLSFWGGVSSDTGEVIDRHHPLSGERLAGRVLAIPGSRGSCSGSGVVLELILNGQGPAAILLERPEAIITLGVIVAQEVFGVSIPVHCLGPDGFQKLPKTGPVRVGGTLPASPETVPAITLSEKDQALLDGRFGAAAQVAMRIVLRMAAIEGAAELLDITQAHIDGCIYTGPGGLAFAERLRDLGGKVVVPTTLNAISVDQRRWRSQGVDPAFADAASRLADAYVDMGAQPSFTCAPYLLDTAPKRDEQIVWAESNAVVYANSVLGARTMKYPDYLDICIALTGRAPKAGCHIDSQRQPTLRIVLPSLSEVDDSFYPLVGYLTGMLAADDIPIIDGIADPAPDSDHLKAFGAAFATTSGAPMFHIAGVTPEARDADDFMGLSLRHVVVSQADLLQAWGELNATAAGPVELISLGNPHFSVTEIARLAKLCAGKTCHPDVATIVTCGRWTLEQARKAGHVADLERFGVQFVTDTCWCMIIEPLIPQHAKTIMTNSGKYAHYGPGLTGRAMRFGSLADCVEAAVSGLDVGLTPEWIAAH
ncbi:aconitase X [Rhizobium sp. 18065]|uniref:cis-3-hydroxy-L-proline dehydratase n=1 Tax=Rhizobium sp. 18065 TaxID=2681411 RepID=UPI00135BBADD|nr:aconitase X [Rhizobium sp. 18065]